MPVALLPNVVALAAVLFCSGIPAETGAAPTADRAKVALQCRRYFGCAPASERRPDKFNSDKECSHVHPQ